MKVIGAVIFGKFKIHENTITNLFLKARKKASFEHVTSCLHILIFLVLYSAVVSVPVSEPIRNKHEFFCFSSNKYPLYAGGWCAYVISYDTQTERQTRAYSDG